MTDERISLVVWELGKLSAYREEVEAGKIGE